jgi:anti-anti-sigma factor
MEVQFSEVGGVTKAALGGRLDSRSVRDDAQGEAYFFSHIPKEQPAVVDLSRVSFIASLGVRMLIDTARALDRNGARLALYGANDNVLDILKYTEIRHVITVVDTEAEAVAAVMG